MNTQFHNDLASSKKIDKVFHAFGHSIPVAKDGRRLWPSKFKREMANKLETGELTVAQIAKTCNMPQWKVQQWKREKPPSSAGKSLPPQKTEAAFAEIKVVPEERPITTVEDAIIFWCKKYELKLPPTYPIESLAQIIRVIGAGQ